MTIDRPASSSRTHRRAGFTLVELLVVLALIAILSGLAVSYAGEPRASVRGFTEQLVGEADSTRLRAISTRRWHRLRYVDASRRFVVEQADTVGMIAPVADEDWSTVAELALPETVAVASIATTTNIVDGENVPAEGDGLDQTLMFSPDGSAEPRTVYVQTRNGRVLRRVVIYRATGSAYDKEGW